MTYQQIKAIEAKNKRRILDVNPNVDEESGIYIFMRYDSETHIKYAYVGQAKHLLTRLAQHLHIGISPQHIDLSLKKRGLWNIETNPAGWNFTFLHFPQSELNERETELIRVYSNNGFQLYNHTTGSQGEGKRALGEAKCPKGYYDGLKQGYENARREIKHLFDLHLNVAYKANKPSKNAIKALDKFNEFLEGDIDG